MKNTTMKNTIRTILTLSVLFLYSCENSDMPFLGNSSRIVATVFKGLVDGASCDLLKADGSSLTDSVRSVSGKATFNEFQNIQEL
jgi:hypothetical protein